jgi:replication-associated recombination protein RarA
MAKQKEPSWGPYEIRTKTGLPYDEVISGLQKMIRRGKEREALVLAQELFDSRYNSAVARRLMIIAPEDIGLANPQAVATATTLCEGYLTLNDKRGKGKPPVEPIALYMAIMILCRSPKNRETDNAQIAIFEAMKANEISAKQVIDENEAVIVDRHTDRGKERLKLLAAANGTTYEQEAMKEFLTVGAKLEPQSETGGDRWAKEVMRIYSCQF